MSQISNATNASYAAQWQYLQSIQQSGADPTMQARGGDPMSFALDPFAGASGQTSATGSANSGPPFSLDAMSALIAAQEQSGTSGLSNYQQQVFGKLDADGDGNVTSAELQSAFGADNKDAADYVMSKLDTNGDGSISQSEFGAGTTRGPGGHHHHHMHAGPPPDSSQGAQGAQDGQGAQDPLAQLLSSSADGASSQTTSNTDGSTTTTITYSDGSKVSMTSAAAASPGTSGSDTSASGSNLSQTQQNLLEQLIKLQSQLIQNLSASSATTSSLATV